MRTAVFLQARLASKRFPRKVLAKLGDSTVIETAMERLRSIPCDDYVIVTDWESEGELGALANRHDWLWFGGESDDVMRRFIDAAGRFHVDVIVRATADNPLVDVELGKQLLAIQLEFTGDSTRALGATPGVAVEVVARSALARWWPSASRGEREHVMPAVYQYGRSNVLWWHRKYRMSVSIDTLEDLERVEGLLS